AEGFDGQRPTLEVEPVEVGDLKLATRRGLQRLRQQDGLRIVEVEPRYGVAGLRLFRLFLERSGAPSSIEADHAIALRIDHMMRKDRGTAGSRLGALQHHRQIVAEEQIVAQHQRRRATADEMLADEERLRQPLGLRLRRKAEVEAPSRSPREQPLEQRQIVRRRDDEDVAYAAAHQRRQRIVDHRLVVDRQQLLADRRRRRHQSRPGPTGENNALARHTLPSLWSVVINCRMPSCQGGSVTPKAVRSLVVSSRELAGRLARAGYSEAPIGTIASGAALSIAPAARASATRNCARPCQLVSPAAAR